MPYNARRNYTIPIRIRACSVLLVGCVLLLSACGTPSAGTPGSTSKPLPTATVRVPTLATPLVTYKRHTGGVIGVAWSPDGKRIASAGDDGTVQVWDAMTGTQVWSYCCHADT